jgi:hypothetical protein
MATVHHFGLNATEFVMGNDAPPGPQPPEH